MNRHTRKQVILWCIIIELTLLFAIFMMLRLESRYGPVFKVPELVPAVEAIERGGTDDYASSKYLDMQ